MGSQGFKLKAFCKVASIAEQPPATGPPSASMQVTVQKRRGRKLWNVISGRKDVACLKCPVRQDLAVLSGPLPSLSFLDSWGDSSVLPHSAETGV